MAIQKFYFHDAATSDTGTLPSGEQSASSPSVTATNGTTNRSMDATHGTSQVAASLTTLTGTSAQPSLYRMFLSAPLKAQTIAAGTWQLSMAASEAATAANIHLCMCLYAWRPSTGAIVGTRIVDSPSTSTGNVTEPGTTPTAVTDTSISGGAVTIQDGDILVCEIWHDSTTAQSSGARSTSFFYDGTTEASTTSCASFLNAPAQILELADVVNITHDASASSSITSNRNLSFSHVTDAAAKKLYVTVVVGESGDASQTIAVTYNSVSMTDTGAGQKHSNNGSNGYEQVFELDNPASGSHTVAIAVTGGVTPGTLIGMSDTYIPASGFALQTGTPVTAAVAQGTSPITVNLTSTTSGNMVYGGGANGTLNGITPLLTQRSNVNVNSSSAAGNGSVEDGLTFGGTVAVGFTVNDDSALIAFEIQAIAAADTGTGSVRVKKPSLSGVATAPLQGTGSIRIKKPGTSGAGQQKLFGTGSVRMKKPSATGLAAIKLFATGSVRVKKPALSGVGQEKLIGSGSVRMKKMGVSGTATAPLLGSGSVRMHKPSLAITGIIPIQGSGSISMHKPSLAAIGKGVATATGSVRMHKMGILASGSVGLTDIGNGSVAMHKMSLSATGKEIDAGTGSVSMHKMGLSAAGHAPLLGSGSISMHKPSLSATGKGVDAGTGSVRMKKMGVSATGHAPLLGSGSVSMHKMAVHVTGIVGTFIVGTGSVRMKKMGVSGLAKEVLLGTGSVRMKKPSATGLAAIIIPGTGSVHMHKMHLSGSAKVVINGTGSVHMHKMVPHGTMADLGSGSAGMHKMAVHGTAVSLRRASNLFIFTAV